MNRTDYSRTNGWRVLLLLAFFTGAGLLQAHASGADSPTLNVELIGTLDSIWPRSEPFVAVANTAFVPAISPASGQIIGIAVVDVSRPDVPSHATTLPDTFLSKLYANGNYLFGEKKTGTNSFETHVYTFQGAAQPTFIGSAIPGQVVYSDSQYAVLLRQGGLKTIDLANPEDGVFPEVGGYSGAEALRNVTTVGVLAYAGIDNGIKVLSLGTPSSPAELGTLHFAQPFGAVAGITVAGNYAYVKTAGGLVIVDVSNPGSPTEAAHGTIPGFTGNLQATGGLLYTANSDGLHVYSLTNPIAPVEVGYYRETAGGEWLQIVAAGTTVYAAVRFDVGSGRAEFRALRFTNAPNLGVQATGPGVAVNGAPLAVGATQSLVDGDQVQGTSAESAIDLKLFCEDLESLILLMSISRTDSLLGDLDEHTWTFVTLARFYIRACLPGARRNNRIRSDQIELALLTGGIRVNGAAPDLELTVRTPAAAIHSLGANHFVAIQATAGQTTTVVARLGTVLVTPVNTALTPVSLSPGQQVDVSPTAMGPVIAHPVSHVYLPLLAD